MKLTIAICVHNRPTHLARCLDALMPQMKPGLEVLVCDSASSSDNGAVAAEVVARYPSIGFRRIERPGLALARNSLLAQARGEWFALLDDDTTPGQDWVAIALDLTTRLQSDVAVVGGAVHPIMPEHPPIKAVDRAQMGLRWMQLCSIVSFEGDFDQTDRPRVVGANMWFRTDQLRSIGGFPENLGRKGASLLSGEEKLLAHTLIEQGWRVWYCSRMYVGHELHGERLTKRWATARSYWDGITDRRVARMLRSRLSRGHSLKVAIKLMLLAPLYFVPSSRHEFFLRFWYGLGWVCESMLPSSSGATD